MTDGKLLKFTQLQQEQEIKKLHFYALSSLWLCFRMKINIEHAAGKYEVFASCKKARKSAFSTNCKVYMEKAISYQSRKFVAVYKLHKS